jgi:hypothetical protein
MAWDWGFDHKEAQENRGEEDKKLSTCWLQLWEYKYVHSSKLIKMFLWNVCTLICVNYTWIELALKEKMYSTVFKNTKPRARCLLYHLLAI